MTELSSVMLRTAWQVCVAAFRFIDFPRASAGGRRAHSHGVMLTTLPWQLIYAQDPLLECSVNTDAQLPLMTAAPLQASRMLLAAAIVVMTLLAMSPSSEPASYRSLIPSVYACSAWHRALLPGHVGAL